MSNNQQPNIESQTVAMQKDIEYIKEMLHDFKEHFLKNLDVQNELQKSYDKKYVTQDQFRPVKWFVYGLITIILTTVLASILATILQK